MKLNVEKCINSNIALKILLLVKHDIAFLTLFLNETNDCKESSKPYEIIEINLAKSKNLNLFIFSTVRLFHLRKAFIEITWLDSLS